MRNILWCIGTPLNGCLNMDVRSLYYIGLYLEHHPEASEEDLHVGQWEPYDNGRNGKMVEGITPEQAIRNILLYLDRNGLEALHSSTQIIIAPGYEYKIVKILITNFHLLQFEVIFE